MTNSRRAMNRKNKVLLGRIVKTTDGYYSFRICIDDTILAKKIKEMKFFILANDYKNIEVSKGCFEGDMNYV